MKKLLMTLKALWQKPLIRLLTSLLILGLIFTQLPLTDLWQTLRQVSPGLWLLAVLVFIAGHGVGVAKWTLLINLGRGQIPFTATFRYYFAGLFANLFLPSIAGGDVVRAGMAIGYRPQQKEAVVLGSLLDRFLDMLALALLILAGGFLSPLALAAEDKTVLWVMFGLLLVGIVGGLLLLLMPLPQRLPAKLTALIERVRHLVAELFKNPWRAIIGLMLALVIQSAFILLNAFLGRAIGIELALPVWFLAWPLAKLSATLPISLGGLGVREAALVVFLGRFAVPPAGAVAVGLLWQTILIAGGAFGGIFYFFAARRHIPTDFPAVAPSNREVSP